jgi:hypothetical protein
MELERTGGGARDDVGPAMGGRSGTDRPIQKTKLKKGQRGKENKKSPKELRTSGK